MAITIGSTDISNIYVGSTAVSAVYVGSTKVWPSGGAGQHYSWDFTTMSALPSGFVTSGSYSMNGGIYVYNTATYIYYPVDLSYASTVEVYYTGDRSTVSANSWVGWDYVFLGSGDNDNQSGLRCWAPYGYNYHWSSNEGTAIKIDGTTKAIYHGTTPRGGDVTYTVNINFSTGLISFTTTDGYTGSTNSVSYTMSSSEIAALREVPYVGAMVSCAGSTYSRCKTLTVDIA